LPVSTPAAATTVAAPVVSAVSGVPALPAPSLAAPLRPTWLLEPPEPLASDAYGRPLHGGPLQLCSRAERIEAGWFDGGLARRDYHVALGSDQRLRWIYRERRAGAAAGGWFLHGWFG
jgi:protein ImuB